MSPSPTVLEALQWPTTTLDAAESRPGPNTTVKTNLLIQQWEEWSEFTFENITAVFGNVLDRKYVGQEEPVALKRDVEVYSEASADAGLRRFPFPVINNALSSMTGKPENAPYYGHGTRVMGYELKPDWSCISNQAKRDSKYINLVPGDTKTSAKFDPDMLESNYKEWKKVVTQLAAYADEHRVRYGFIVTDKLVVVLRFTRKREVVARGAGANLPIRSTRAPTPQVSSESGIPSSQSSSGREIPSSQSFEDDDQGKDLHVEYKEIPWSAHGRDTLTAKVALFALAMMPLHGDNYIACSYPKINTWRGGDDGIRHNTSGEFRVKVTRYTKLDEPEEEDEEDDKEDDEDDEEEDELQISATVSIIGDTDHLAPDITRLKKVKNVEFTKQKGVWYYKDCRGKPVPYKEGQFEYHTTLKRYVRSGRRYKYVAKRLPDM
ncbi:hypothetical protein H634G_06459 [Metarhizium anisopliae BRIP 53293]|uniref:Uncharacterized protein n=1 Tax=Metarhizium anisopliae BRIP 53293 TaxID=1291518 RepID=A0A0D9NWP7_METAN|nr:hypothetical protein H634G_06459 [Metarhizium anisopliae BRIP 53293]KJK90475.1 hypothetical protein H633G_05654 [Metarhizium anisopliae BRIP 53284]